MKTVIASRWLLVWLLAVSCCATAQAQTKKNRAQSVAEAPAVPAPAEPAPAPAVMEAPAEAAPLSSYQANSANAVTSLNGIYLGGCEQVPNQAGELSSLRYTTVSEEGAKIQFNEAFFVSANCAGSVYANYQHAVRTTRTVTKSNGQLSNGTPVLLWRLQLAEYQSRVAAFGAVLLPQNEQEQISVILTGKVVATHPGVERKPAENLLIGAVSDGIFLASNQTRGMALDAQGFPTGFGPREFLTRQR